MKKEPQRIPTNFVPQTCWEGPSSRRRRVRKEGEEKGGGDND